MAKGKGKSPPGHNGDANGAPATKPATPPARPRASASGATESDTKLPLAPGVKYRRILLKLSGEALMGATQNAIDSATLSQIADELVDVHGLGVEIAMVLGRRKHLPRHRRQLAAAWTAPTPTTWGCWRR